MTEQPTTGAAERPEPAVVFVDTETMLLGPHRHFWELAAIVRRPGGSRDTDTEHTWMVDLADLDFAHADRQSLDVGRFYERHPQARLLAAAADRATRYAAAHARTLVQRERAVLEAFLPLTHDAHLVGSNTAFDDECLRRRLHANGLLHGWYYKAQCVQTLIRGYLAARGRALPLNCPSYDLFRAVGIDPDDYDLHSALGDARLARDGWDRVHSPELATTAPAQTPVGVLIGGKDGTGTWRITFEEDVHSPGTAIGVNPATGQARILRDGDLSLGRLIQPVAAGMVVPVGEYLAWPIDPATWIPAMSARR